MRLKRFHFIALGALLAVSCSPVAVMAADLEAEETYAVELPVESVENGTDGAESEAEPSESAETSAESTESQTEPSASETEPAPETEPVTEETEAPETEPAIPSEPETETAAPETEAVTETQPVEETTEARTEAVTESADGGDAEEEPVAITFTYEGLAGQDDWYRSDVTISAAGYQIGEAAEGPFADTYTVTETGEHEYTFYVCSAATGAVQEAEPVTIRIDEEAPTGSVTFTMKWWQQLLNWITFGWWKPGEVDITAQSADQGGSGVYGTYYLKAAKSGAYDTDTIADDSLAWKKYSAGTKPTAANGSESVYLKVEDGAGNVTYIWSEGRIPAPGEEETETTSDQETDGTSEENPTENDGTESATAEENVTEEAGTDTPTPEPVTEPTEPPESETKEEPVPVVAVTDTPTPTATDTPAPTATDTPEPTATDTPTPTATDTPTPTATDTPTPTATVTPEPTATDTPTPEPTDTETPAPEPTVTDTPTPEPIATDTPVPTDTPTPELTEVAELSPAVTEPESDTDSASETETETETEASGSSQKKVSNWFTRMNNRMKALLCVLLFAILALAAWLTVHTWRRKDSDDGEDYNPDDALQDDETEAEEPDGDAATESDPEGEPAPEPAEPVKAEIVPETEVVEEAGFASAASAISGAENAELGAIDWSGQTERLDQPPKPPKESK